MANNSKKDNTTQTDTNYVHEFYKTRKIFLTEHCITCPHRGILSKADTMMTHQQSIVKSIDALQPYHCYNQEIVPYLALPDSSFPEFGSSGIVQQYRTPNYEDIKPLLKQKRIERIADEAFFRMLVAYKENKLDRLPDDFTKIFQKFNFQPVKKGNLLALPPPSYQSQSAAPQSAIVGCIDYRIKTEMVIIGDGHARVPASVINNMNWNSYTNCTRKLLTAIFPRSILATHCLATKQPLALTGQPAVKILDPLLINDIIKIVTEKCGATANQVRMSIATKCADESKMFRTRVQRSKNVEKQVSSRANNTDEL